MWPTFFQRTWARYAIASAAFLVLGLLFGYPALADLTALGSGNDWDQHLLYHWAPFVSVTQYGELPLWNPWACGGTPLLANPQTRFLSPFFLLHLAVGPVAGLHLELVLHLAILAAGGYFLGKTLGLRFLGCSATALVFLGTSAHYLHLGMGHSWMMSYAYLPWILAFVLRAIESSRLWPAFVAGALLALVILEGGIYPGPHAALLVGLVCIGFAAHRRSLFPIKIGAVTALCAAGLASPKLFPVLQLMSQHPRKTEAIESTSLSLLFESLFSRNQVIGRFVAPQEGITWGFHEYGAYLGPAAALLVVAALVLARRRAIAFAILGAVFLWLACGCITLGGVPLGLWQALHSLPVFGSQHVPSRFLVPFILCAAVLAGLGADALGKRWGRRGAVAAAVLILVGAADSWRVGPASVWQMYDAPQNPVGPPGPFHHEYWGDSNLMMPLAQANRGALHCYESVYLKIAAQMPGAGFKGEEYLESGEPIRQLRWGPNALEFETAATKAPTVLVVNQNFDAGWKLVEPKGRTFSRDGVIAAELPAGTTRIRLEYRSTSFLFGLVLAACIAVVGFWLRRRERALPAP